MRTFTRRTAAVLLTWGVMGIGAPASAATDPPATQPTSTTQPEADGCTRDPLGLVAGTAVHWVYVFKDPTPRYMRGVAANAYPTYTDLFTAHSSYDMNVFFKPASAYHNYLGTANTATDTTQEKDEQDTMEIEWEQRAMGLPSWPTEGDDVELLGSWIWDCGHWGPQTFTDPRYFTPGTQPGEVVTGERTEMHPPRMVVTHRALPSVTPNGDAVADVLINSNGTFARADEEKAIGNCLTQAVCSQWIPVNDRDYSFDVA
ncbi:MAG: hypothetical protein LC792_15865, partial [Actinobacteria bacterium]|nr:hypothetical protein [Actinomycetota bacterium]